MGPISDKALALGLGAIESIEGFLMVQESHALTSLEHLGKLNIIHGNLLYQKRYGPFIFDILRPLQDVCL